MFAAPVGIDRPIKRQIRRSIITDDAARHLNSGPGAQYWQHLVTRPTVVDRFLGVAFKPPHLVAARGPTQNSVTLIFFVHK